MAVSLLKLALKLFVKNPVFSLISLFSLEQAFFLHFILYVNILRSFITKYCQHF